MMRDIVALLFCAVVTPIALHAQSPRARDIGIPLDGTPGPYNAITDVAGVEVGHTTLISGSGKLVMGKGPVRTGVTVIHPRGKAATDPVFAAWFTLNGNGEMTGTTWIQESGFLEGPIAITNTHSVGVVRDAILQWQTSRPGLQPWGLPVVAETYDGFLNDINGFHVKPEHVFSALDGAKGGVVQEGAVGGGTGMVCNGFKGGIGTSSRKLSAAQGGYTVGVLVQCNFGRRPDLMIAGVPVGKEIPDLTACVAQAAPITTEFGKLPACVETARQGALAPSAPSADASREMGSIIIVVATDAPLLPHQLKRIVTRAALGVARLGGRGGNSSGDIFVAFSTANPHAAADSANAHVEMLPNTKIDPLFAATIEATEESIINAMLAAKTMTGANDIRVYELPVDRLKAVMKKYGR